jgi:hypothetical protein
MSTPVPRIAAALLTSSADQGTQDPASLAAAPTLFRKPASPDPFVNAAMTSLGVGETGLERFWISSVNSLCGATSFLLDEEGEHRQYDWPIARGIRAIYSVAPEDTDTLWLAGGALQHFIRLQLSSGQWEMYPWGAGRFATAGMAFDADTGKLFCGAQTALLSFDTRSRSVVRVYGDNEGPPENHHYDHWRLPDGSYGFVLETPGLSFLRWDPRDESVRWQRLTEDQSHPAMGQVRHLKYTDGARVYLPHLGWLDGMTGELTPHDHPPRQEACWFGADGSHAVGARSDRLTGSVTVLRWDLATGHTRELCTLPDTNSLSLALTRSGKIVLVDLYGRFQRYDAESGELELTRHVGVAREHRCNAIVPVGAGRVAGTPFISQNFWVHDTSTGLGQCLGRAGGSLGQVDHAVAVGGKIYLAIYGGGQLTEYDPELPAGFPRNPHVVARNDQGQHGAGITTDGTVVWNAFKPRYGMLDGAMLRLDTSTGAATYRNGAVPGQHVLNPVYDSHSGQLVAGTCCLSDCETARPIHDTASAVALDPGTMDVRVQALAPAGVDTVLNHGPLGQGRWLCRGRDQLLIFDTHAGTLEPWCDGPRLPDGAGQMLYSGTPGLFLIQVGEELRCWRPESDQCGLLAHLDPKFVRRWWVHGNALTFDCGHHAGIWCGAIGELTDFDC